MCFILIVSGAVLTLASRKSVYVYVYLSANKHCTNGARSIKHIKNDN